MLDPEFGETINDFHEHAAEEFARLATDFNTGSAPLGVAEKIQGGKTIVEPSSEAHGSDVGETVSEDGERIG